MNALFIYIDQMGDVLFLIMIAGVWLIAVTLYIIFLKKWEGKNAKNIH